MGLPLSFFFTYVGIIHFTNPSLFEDIVPPYIPGPSILWVYISGMCEIVGGLGAFFLPFKRNKSAASK